MAERERDKDGGEGRGSAVERSLDDFIARANTTLPQPTAAGSAQVRSIPARKGQTKAPNTLVVLGPQTPLAEVTEIVNRMPAAELAAPRRRTLAIVGFGVAFAAGAVAVLLATRFISGTPQPVAPTPPPPVVVQSAAPPPPVVVPMPVPAAAPVVEPAPPAPEPAPAPEVTAAPPPKQKRPAKIARKTPATAAPKPAPPSSTAKKPGLVDPFAN